MTSIDDTTESTPYWRTWISLPPTNPQGRPFTFANHGNTSKEQYTKEEYDQASAHLANIFGMLEDGTFENNLKADRVTSRITDMTRENDENQGSRSDASNYSLHPDTKVIPSFSVEVIETPGRGRGLRALRDIDTNELIFGEYTKSFLFEEFSKLSMDEISLVCGSYSNDFWKYYSKPLGLDGGEGTDEEAVIEEENVENSATTNLDENTTDGCTTDDCTTDDYMSFRDGKPISSISPLCSHCFTPILNPSLQLQHSSILHELEDEPYKNRSIQYTDSLLDQETLLRIGFKDIKDIYHTPKDIAIYFPTTDTPSGCYAMEALQECFSDMISPSIIDEAVKTRQKELNIDQSIQSAYKDTTHSQLASSTIASSSICNLLDFQKSITNEIPAGGLSVYSFYTRTAPQFCSKTCYQHTIERYTHAFTFPSIQTLAGFATGIDIKYRDIGTIDGYTISSQIKDTLTEDEYIAIVKRISAIQFGLACNLNNIVGIFWTTGFKILQLYSTLISTLFYRVEQRHHCHSDGTDDIDNKDRRKHWWMYIDNDDWEFVLTPFSSFTRPSYISLQNIPKTLDTSDAVDTVNTSNTFNTSGVTVNVDRIEERAGEGINDDDNADGSNSEYIDAFLGNYSMLVDCMWPCESDEAVPFASEILCPRGLIDALLGSLVSNTQVFGSLPSIALYSHNINNYALSPTSPTSSSAVSTSHMKSKSSSAIINKKRPGVANQKSMQGGLKKSPTQDLQKKNRLNAETLVDLWANTLEDIQNNDEYSACAHISGMFPWHACLNHCCEPNAMVSPDLHCFQLLRSLPQSTPVPKSLASAIYIRAMKPIKKGEEVCISYIDDAILYDLLEEKGYEELAQEYSQHPDEDTRAKAVSIGIKEVFGWDCVCQICVKRDKKENERG